MKQKNQSLPALNREQCRALVNLIMAPTVRPGFSRDTALWEAARYDLIKALVHRSGHGDMIK